MGFWSFSFQFWAAIAGGFDLHTAFISARDAMKSYQTPQLDVDGDGVGNEKADYEGAVNLFIDGRLVSADPVPYLVPTRLTPATTTSDSATLSVRVGPPGVDLRHLWALVVSPVDSPGNPATQISTLAFSPGEKSGIYEGTYDGFIMDGIYRMLLFASTPADLNSAPVLMEVIRQNGILLADMDGNGIYDEVDSAIGLNILAGRYDERLRPDHALSDMNKNQRIDPEETAFVLQKRIQISPSY
jgi:hypothetical protein